MHVRALEERSVAAGIATRVINSNRAGLKLIAQVFLHACRGWTVHFHTNGHNSRSWLLAGICGLASRIGPGGMLTLHSGMVPAYVRSASPLQRLFARFVCSLYRRVICVSVAIRTAITSLGVRITRTELSEAYLGVQATGAPLDPELENWIRAHAPVLCTALFFRPEYGFDVLLAALRELRGTHPLIGCVVMGDSDHRGNAQRAVSAAGLQSHVLLAGDLRHSDCVNLIARCNVFVRPTLEDGDSVSVREAVGLGVPVVASEVGTRPPEAILFPCGDPAGLSAKVRLAIENPKRLEQYA